jgi:drug/metabolite transporter (DMT)-like permease
MSEAVSYLGEASALACAVVWAFAVILFKRSGETVHPVGLNLFKSSLALVLTAPTIVLAGETLAYPAPVGDYLLLLLSGALGIGLADTFFFMSLNIIGAGYSAIVSCLYSPFIIGLSVIWLGERLGVVQVLGVVMIVSAVLSATRRGKASELTGRALGIGMLWGVLGLAVMAIGIVMIKPVLNRSPLLWANEVRLVGGCLTIAVGLVFHPGRARILRSVVANQRWVYTLFGSLLGTYVAMILWLAGMKFAQVSVASALNQTSNIFVFAFGALFLREPLTRLRVLGILIGVVGAYLVMFG